VNLGAPAHQVDAFARRETGGAETVSSVAGKPCDADVSVGAAHRTMFMESKIGM
jgi:hypothetical protein